MDSSFFWDNCIKELYFVKLFSVFQFCSLKVRPGEIPGVRSKSLGKFISDVFNVRNLKF
jgi:hypothetical protein